MAQSCLILLTFLTFSVFKTKEINFRKIPPVLSHVILNNQAVDVFDSYKILYPSFVTLM